MESGGALGFGGREYGFMEGFIMMAGEREGYKTGVGACSGIFEELGGEEGGRGEGGMIGIGRRAGA